MSGGFSKTLTVLAMEHHDLQNIHGKIKVERACKEESPPPQWLLTTIWHKQQNRGRCELKEDNLAPFRLTIFLTIFLLFSMVEL